MPLENTLNHDFSLRCKENFRKSWRCYVKNMFLWNVFFLLENSYTYDVNKSSAKALKQLEKKVLIITS